MRYVLLIAPSSNRVYAGQAPRLAQAELAAFAETVLADAGVHDAAPQELAGVSYLGFSTLQPLTEVQLGYLSNLSSAYALFGVEGEVLRPVRLSPLAHYDDDLVSILKYPGKTNEQFTRLLLNLTVAASGRAAELCAASGATAELSAASGRAAELSAASGAAATASGGLPDRSPEPPRRLVVCDPLCGRGTTLNQALRYGYDAVGIETDGGHVDAYAAFLRTWLRRKRLKHSVELHPVRHERQRLARRLTATLAPTREAYQAGEVQRLTVLHADTLRARELVRPRTCDVIVTDAPYGVAHGARSTGRSGRDRSPLTLLDVALPGWTALLRPGGALGLSFNTHVADRKQVADLLAGHGLQVVSSPGFQGFAHWVDQGITRDLLVARA